jgi:hypothetical protein
MSSEDKTSVFMRKENEGHRPEIEIVSERTLDLMRAAEEIQLTEAREAGALGFMNQTMVLATLPHRNPGKNVTEWVRTNGNFTFVCQSGKVFENGQLIDAGIPYGSKPRLLTLWISTEATRTQNKVLELGESLSAFMRAIGLDQATGGKNGSITTLRDQMRRTLTANFQGILSGEKDRDQGGGYRIAKSYDLWWLPQSPDQAGLWQSTLTLSEDFFNEILRNPVPVDLRAIRVLRSSPMAIDIYSWLTHRNSYLKTEAHIPWKMLQMQFGSRVQNLFHFKEQFEISLQKVLAVYPQARIRVEKDRLILVPSPTHVRRIK